MYSWEDLQVWTEAFLPQLLLLLRYRARRQGTIIQYNTIQYNTIQYNTIQYNTIQYNTIQYNTIQYNTIQIQYNTIQYNTIQYNTIQYNTIQHNTTQQKTWLIYWIPSKNVSIFLKILRYFIYKFKSTNTESENMCLTNYSCFIVIISKKYFTKSYFTLKSPVLASKGPELESN